MPVFFFNRLDGHFQRDTEGTDLPDLDAAVEEAIIFLGQSIKDHPGLVKQTGELKVEIVNEAGDLLKTIMVRAIAPNQ